MTEYEFWNAYREYEEESLCQSESHFFIDYCNNQGIRNMFSIVNVCESKIYPGCFEADCESSYYENQQTGEQELTSRRTFSYKNVIKTYND